MSAIAAAFVQAQRNFAPALKKADNPYFGSKYADLAVCIEAVIDALHDNGIALIQHTDQSDKGVIVSTVFMHESGEHMETGSIFVPAAQNSPQAFGSALTYARRYSLMTACGIAPEDDDGNAASKPVQQKTIYQGEMTAPAKDYDVWNTKFGDVSSYATAAEAEMAGTPSHGASEPTEVPMCKHGDRVWKQQSEANVKAGKKNWGGYMCPERGDDQCQPFWYVFSSNGMWRAQ
jgi:hypothetical protein